MTQIPPNQDRPVTLKDVEDKFKEFFVLKDEGVIELCAACFIANRSNNVPAPVWLMLVAESSGGKTEIIDLFSELQKPEYGLAYYVSDLSPQTFISGMTNNAVETSLLHKINKMMVFFKDFTTILQKNKEARKEILSQLREIYDGGFNKDFGTGKSVHWEGRIGIMAGLTPPALELMSQFAGMGERFINYYMKQPTDAELEDAIAANYGRDIKTIKKEAAVLMAQYIYQMVERAEEQPPEAQQLNGELLKELNMVAQFATRARSPVALDFKTGEPIGLPSIERFPRFAIQLQSIAKAYVLMNNDPNGRITGRQTKTLHQIAIDSIPRTRRAVLQILAKHRSVSTSAAAAKLGFTTPIMRGYLAQLASLGLAMRIPKGGRGSEDAWKLMPKYVEFMKRFEGITQSDEDLYDEDDVELEITTDVSISEEERAQSLAEKIRMSEETKIATLYEENKHIEGFTYEKAREIRAEQIAQEERDKRDPYDF